MGQLRAVNVLVHLQALGLLAQALLAGLMMEAVGGAGDTHRFVGDLLPVIALVQVAVAALARRAGAPGWVLWASVVLLVGQVAIVGAGHAAVMGVHVPFATALLGVAVWMIVALVGRGGALRASG